LLAVISLSLVLEAGGLRWEVKLPNLHRVPDVPTSYMIVLDATARRICAAPLGDSRLEKVIGLLRALEPLCRYPLQ
jgi:hypothetical protein